MAAQHYGVQVESEMGIPIYVLTDANHGAEARVVPARGHNCFIFRTTVDGILCDVMAHPHSLSDVASAPSHWGNPVLFPFPNRIRGGKFEFDGKTVDLHDTAARGNAIHGLVMKRSWQVAHAGADDDSAWVRAVASTADLPDILDHWPFPFTFALTYRLKDGALHIEAEATNTGVVPMPMGYGIHPYFNIPFVQGSSRADYDVLVPASGRWILDESTVPTGEVRPVSGDRDVRSYRPVEHLTFDDVYTGLDRDGDWSICRLRDRRVGLEFQVRSDRTFREMVVFTPPWHSAICFEPYTCTTDAFNLAARGIDSGMIVLAPGRTWAGTVVMEVTRAV